MDGPRGHGHSPPEASLGIFQPETSGGQHAAQGRHCYSPASATWPGAPSGNGKLGAAPHQLVWTLQNSQGPQKGTASVTLTGAMHQGELREVQPWAQGLLQRDFLLQAGQRLDWPGSEGEDLGQGYHTEGERDGSWRVSRVSCTGSHQREMETPWDPGPPPLQLGLADTGTTFPSRKGGQAPACHCPQPTWSRCSRV